MKPRTHSGPSGPQKNLSSAQPGAPSGGKSKKALHFSTPGSAPGLRTRSGSTAPPAPPSDVKHVLRGAARAKGQGASPPSPPRPI